jgi:hypothetical protein
MEFIIVQNGDILNIICAEAVIEDLIGISKKAFEKGAINFNECVRFIRSITREAMKAKYFRQKILDLINKK